MERGEWFAEEIFRRVAENAAEAIVDEEKFAIGRNDGEQFPGNREKRSGLLLGKFRDAVGH